MQALDPRTRYFPGGPKPYPDPNAPPVELHTSAPSLPLANGSGTVIFDTVDRSVSGFFNHMYKKYDKGSVTADLCQKARITVEGVDAPGELGYVNGTGILREKRSQGPLEVEQYHFMPMGGEATERMMVMVTKVTNTGDAPVDASLAAELDFNVGNGGAPDPNNPHDDVDHKWRGNRDETMMTDGKTVWEYSQDQPHMMAYRVAGEGAESLVQGEQIRQGGMTTVGDALKAVFREKMEALEPGESRWVAVLVGHEEKEHFPGADWQAEARQALEQRFDDYLGGRSPEALLEAEKSSWDSYHAQEPNLDHLSEDRQAVYRQSTAFLKMGQVEESHHPEASGQILASLKDKWARSWVRDASYAIVGQVRAGHMEEAGKALQFMIDGRRDPDNDYLAMINEDLPEGKKLDNYLLSVCRYYGNGQEESDWNQAGPNIEYDNFGLFLWAFSEYASQLPEEQRAAFLEKNLEKVETGVADALVKLTNDKGLINPDSSIWEHHWNLPLTYDGRRHYAYTSITAFQGLASFADVLDGAGKAEEASRYREGAGRIQEGVRTHLTHPDGTVASSAEDLFYDPSTAYDAATLEAVNWRLVEGDQAATTVQQNLEKLDSRTPGSPGVMRNDDGNWYDAQEWLLLDLRAADALRTVGREQEADQVVDWVTDWARQNYDGIGELLDEEGNFEGPFPMAGFGPGAYVIANSR